LVTILSVKIRELSAISGLSRQWLNKLVDGKGVPGVRRKPNGRLDVYDESAAREWAEQGREWEAGGMTPGSREARRRIALEIVYLQEHGQRMTSDTIPAIAERCGVSKQALYQALNTGDLGTKGFIRRYFRQRVK
jgi:predicted DNA-binding transcriptional regulator AlpA